MNEEELKVLVEAANSLGIPPSKLSATNPYKMKGDVAQSMQMAVEAANPLMAAQWKAESLKQMNLEAAAAKAGVLQMTNGAHQELMSADPDYQQQFVAQQERKERDLLAKWDAAADDLRRERGIKDTVPHTRWGQWTAEQQSMSEAGL